MTTNPLSRRMSVVPDPDHPRTVDAYVEWFNQTFKFAKARVVTGADGKRSVDVQMGRRA